MVTLRAVLYTNDGALLAVSQWRWNLMEDRTQRRIVGLETQLGALVSEVRLTHKHDKVIAKCARWTMLQQIPWLRQQGLVAWRRMLRHWGRKSPRQDKPE